jgi:hypothetical protein
MLQKTPMPRSRGARQARRSPHIARYRAAPERAYAAARVRLGLPILDTSLAALATKFATSPSYISAWETIIKADDDVLWIEVLSGKMCVLKAAAKLRERAEAPIIHEVMPEVVTPAAIAPTPEVTNTPAELGPTVSDNSEADQSVDPTLAELRTLIAEMQTLIVGMQTSIAALTTAFNPDEIADDVGDDDGIGDDNVDDLLAAARASEDVAAFLKKNGLTTLGDVFKE